VYVVRHAAGMALDVLQPRLVSGNIKVAAARHKVDVLKSKCYFMALYVLLYGSACSSARSSATGLRFSFRDNSFKASSCCIIRSIRALSTN
jgi:hypothetical protein